MAINVLPHDIWVIVFVPLVTSFVLNRALARCERIELPFLDLESSVLPLHQHRMVGVYVRPRHIPVFI